MELNEISGQIVDAAICVHRALGPGLLESAYHACLRHEVSSRGLRVESNVPVRLQYKGLTLGTAYRLDLRVESRVIVEIKAVTKLYPVHRAQLLSYLRLSDCPLGLLLNFNVPLMRHGITRMLNPRSSHALSHEANAYQ